LILVNEFVNLGLCARLALWRSSSLFGSISSRILFLRGAGIWIFVFFLLLFFQLAMFAHYKHVLPLVDVIQRSE
jgi:hypothetical protein